MSALEKKVLFTSCFLLISGLMAVDFFNPSLPYIMSDLGASQTAAKTLIVVYMLTLGLAQFFYGTFSDRYGRRPAILVGFAVAAAGLAGSSFCRDMSLLYVARAVTAFGTAGCTVISRAIIVDVFRDQKAMKKAFSYFAMSSQFSPAIAPLIGGVIQQYYGWSMSFLTLSGIMAGSFLCLLLFMPETHPHRAGQVAGLRGVYLPYLQLMGNLEFVLYSVASAVIFAYTIGFYATSPYVFHALGYSPVGNSLFYLSYSAGILSGSWIMGHVLAGMSPGRLYIGTIAGYTVLCAAGMPFDIGASGATIVLFSGVMGTVCGVAAPLALVLSMTGVETSRGAASALQGAIKMFFTGLFMIGFDVIHVRSFLSLNAVFAAFTLLLWLIAGVDRLARAGADKRRRETPA